MVSTQVVSLRIERAAVLLAEQIGQDKDPAVSAASVLRELIWRGLIYLATEGDLSVNQVAIVRGAVLMRRKRSSLQAKRKLERATTAQAPRRRGKGEKR